MDKSSNALHIERKHNSSSSDSELSEVSDTNGMSIDDMNLMRPNLKLRIYSKDPSEVVTDEDDGMSKCRDNLNNGSKNNGSDERPTKRIKMDGRGYDASTSAAAAAHSTSEGTITQSHTPSCHHSPVNSTRFTPAPIKPIDHFTKDLARTAPVNPRSLTMTIIPKAELDTLKSDNNILRSHNVSLARRNTALLADNAVAVSLYEEIKDAGPTNHDSCVNMGDADQLVTENQTLKADMAQLKYEHQLMKECGFEWARLETQWETEQRLLKNEVSDLVARVNELVAKGQRVVLQAQNLEARAQQAEYRAQVAEHTLEQERMRAATLQEYVDRAQAAVQATIQDRNSSSNSSVYPDF